MRKLKPIVATPEEEDTFATYLIEMEFVVEEFLREAADAGFRLDFTLAGLKTLEEYIRSRSQSGIDEKFVNRVARFLGEVFRKSIGGHWELCLKDKNYVYKHLPVITGYSKLPIEFCPIVVATGFCGAMQPGSLMRAMESHQSK